MARRTTWVSLGITLIILCIIIFLIFRFIRQDSESISYQPKEAVASPSVAQLQTLSTPYFSMQIPSGDTPQWRTAKDAKKIQVLIPDVKDHVSYGVQSAPLSGGGLAEVGDISMRQKNPGEYETKTFDFAPKGSLGFWQTTAGSSKVLVIFMPFNGRYISVAVESSTYSYYQFEQDMKQIVQTLKVN
jgi:hypothetical protein